MNYAYRAALPEDAGRCVEIRGRTRENAFSVEDLRNLGITVESWGAGIQDGTLPGYVCLCDGQIVGYCFGNAQSGEIAVVALLPEHENRGIGKTLLDAVVKDLAKLGFKRLFLGCSADPRVRSHGFYRHLGWRATGTVDELNDEVLELRLE